MTTDGIDDRDAIVEPPMRPRLSLVGAPGQKYEPVIDRPAGTRPNLWIRMDTNLDLMVTSTVRCLAKHPNVYARGGNLVEVLGGSIREIPNAQLHERVAEVANFFSVDREKKKVVKSPTQKLVNAVATRGLERWLGDGVRPLDGVTAVPMLRADGTILDTPGYDAATRYLYQPSIDFGTVPSEPTREDALEALRVLVEPLQGYPWRRNAMGLSPSISAYLALILSLFTRHLVDNVPAFGISATTPGSGKTYLAHIPSILLHGDVEEPVTLPKDDEAMDKSLSSILRKGSRYVLFDNVSKPIDFPSLNLLLTNKRYGARILGRTEMGSYTNEAVFAFTGNNLQPQGDLCRRWIPIQLVPSVSDPESIRHDFDPMQRAKQDRALLVRSALTILRAWCVAGRPKVDGRTLGSFPAWSEMIPEVLVWLGMSNPIDTRNDSDVTHDTELSKLAELAEALEMACAISNREWITVQELLRLAYPELPRGTSLPEAHRTMVDRLESALGEHGRTQAGKALPYALRSCRERMLHDGRRIVAEAKRGHVMRWRVAR